MSEQTVPGTDLLVLREALWQVGAVERDPSSLLARVRPPRSDAPLPPMMPLEETAADYATTSLTPGPHLMTYLRAALAARGSVSPATCPRCRTGRRCASPGT